MKGNKPNLDNLNPDNLNQTTNSSNSLLQDSKLEGLSSEKPRVPKNFQKRMRI